MPEWGNLPIPAKLLKQGVDDMVRISDARMSGTSYGTVLLHVVARVRRRRSARDRPERRPDSARRAESRASNLLIPDEESDRTPRGMGPRESPLRSRLRPPLYRAHPASRPGLRLRFSERPIQASRRARGKQASRRSPAGKFLSGGAGLRPAQNKKVETTGPGSRGSNRSAHKPVVCLKTSAGRSPAPPAKPLPAATAKASCEPPA